MSDDAELIAYQQQIADAKAYAKIRNNYYELQQQLADAEAARDEFQLECQRLAIQALQDLDRIEDAEQERDRYKAKAELADWLGQNGGNYSSARVAIDEFQRRYDALTGDATSVTSADPK